MRVVSGSIPHAMHGYLVIDRVDGHLLMSGEDRCQVWVRKALRNLLYGNLPCHLSASHAVVYQASQAACVYGAPLKSQHPVRTRQSTPALHGLRAPRHFSMQKPDAAQRQAGRLNSFRFSTLPRRRHDPTLLCPIAGPTTVVVYEKSRQGVVSECVKRRGPFLPNGMF